MEHDEIKHLEKLIQAARRYAASEAVRIQYWMDTCAFTLSNIADHEDAESVSEANLNAVMELCRKAALKQSDLSEWVDSASSLLPRPFNRIANTAFSMAGLNDELVDEATRAETQNVEKYWDQLHDDQIHRRRCPENEWIEEDES